MRKSVWPLREAISQMQRTDSPLVSETTKIYLRDVYDHTIQVIENIETFRDMSSSLLETYLSSLSNKLNEVIKLLTIISTIFIPLTFLAGALWNELQVYAGAGVCLGLSRGPGADAARGGHHDDLFLAEKMDLGGFGHGNLALVWMATIPLSFRLFVVPFPQSPGSSRSAAQSSPRYPYRRAGGPAPGSPPP